MTRTLKTSRNVIQLCAFGAVLAIAGLIAATAVVDAKERKRIYNKDEFVLLCNSQELKVVCNKENLNCSCDNDKTHFIWHPPHDHNGLLDLTHGPVGSDGDGGGGGRGRGRGNN